MSEKLLQVEELRVGFETASGFLRAVDGVSFDIRRGEVLGLVGESGCGKTVTALSLLRLLPKPPAVIEGGRALFHGRDLLSLPAEELQTVRGGKIGMIFQEPMTALSPLHRIGDQLAESARLHRALSRDEAWALGVDWLKRVGLPDPDQRMKDWPHQLSGGMCQRVLLVMALCIHPKLVIADEPTSSVDAITQSKILSLLLDLQDHFQFAMLFITHDLTVAALMAHAIGVVKAGALLELQATEELFNRPRTDYSRQLISAAQTLARTVR